MCNDYDKQDKLNAAGGFIAVGIMLVATGAGIFLAGFSGFMIGLGASLALLGGLGAYQLRDKTG